MSATSHLREALEALAALEAEAARLEGIGQALGARLFAGARLLCAGNGGSAAEAQHLSAELVGRYRDERMPLSAIALHAETSSLTAIGNDYGFEEVFARQVEAHGRPGDAFLGLSTSGSSANVVRAAKVARRRGMWTIALTGPAPNPLATTVDEVVAVPSRTPAVVQEVHLVIVHLLCEAIDRLLAGPHPDPTATDGQADLDGSPLAGSLP